MAWNAASTVSVCSSCHGNELPAKPMKELAATRDRARPTADVALQFESFSHAVHLHPSALFERGQAITCATCHVRTTGPAYGRDFAAVTSCPILLVRKSWWPTASLAASLAAALDRWATAHPDPGPWAHWLPANLR